MDTRDVVETIYRPRTTEPWPAARFYFKGPLPGGTFAAGETTPWELFAVDTDDAGVLTVALTVNEGMDVGSHWEVAHPSGTRYTFVVPAGVGDLSLSELIAFGVTTEDQQYPTLIAWLQGRWRGAWDATPTPGYEAGQWVSYLNTTWIALVNNPAGVPAVDNDDWSLFGPLGTYPIYGPDEEIPDPPPYGALKIVFQPTPPDTPANLLLAAGEENILASWDALPVGTFTSYETRAVNLATGIAGAWTDTGTVAEYDFDPLLPGVEYRIDVRAVNGTVLSGTASDTATPTGPIDTDPPAVPTGLAAGYVDDVVTLTWTDPVDADLAVIGIYQDAVLIDEVDPGVETWELAGFADPTAPSWTVDAMDTSGNRSAQSSPPVGAPQPAGIQFVASAKATCLTTATSLSIAKPTGAIAGRFMLAVVSLNDAAGVLTAPAGWTLLGSAIVGGSSRQAVYYRFLLSSAEGPFAWSWQNAAGGSGVIQAWRGVHGATPIDVDNGGAYTAAAGTTFTLPTVTTVSTKTRLVDIISILLSSTITAPVSVEHVEVAQTLAGGDRGSVQASKEQVAAGATGVSGTYTLGTSRGTIRRRIALKPANV